MSLSILAFFSILFVSVYFLRMAKIGVLVAFLIAGVLSGPHVFNFFELNETWQLLGNLGVLFLWFNIGLEINIKRLWHMRHTIFGFGAAQVMMVVVMLFPILFGITHWSILGCVMVAMLLSMSSTSTDIQLMTERNQLNTVMGRQTFSILLFQDLLSIPLLAMLPALTGHSFSLGASIIDIVVISATLILSVILIGRFVMTPILRMVSKLKSQEAFLLAIILNIVIWAILLDLMGLPIGLGAFLAGMLMSETIYRHQISSQISPYYTLFMAFFFIALGMGLNLSVLGQNWYIVLFGVIGFMALKLFAVYIVARVRGISVPNAVMIALILSQGSEFALLMLQTMKTSGIRVISSGHEEVLTAIIIISMMLTPLLLCLYDYLQRRGKLFPQRNAHSFDVIDNKVKPVVVVCGFGRVGQIICQMLDSQQIPYVAIDLDVSAVMMGREQGFNVVYGDTTDRSVLIEFGVNARNTRAIAVALDNATTARKTILTIKSISKRIKIFARARNLADTQMLLAEKISYSLPETIESSFLLGSQVLKQLGISNQSVSDLLSDMRANNYQSLSTVISDKYD